MPRIIDHVRFRNNIIDATVESVYQNGFEHATSKSIAQISQVNEANIFRYFIDLHDLYQKTFELSKTVFFENFNRLFEYLKDRKITEEEKKHLMDTVSESIERYKKHVVYFLRYYYSAEFDEKQCNILKENCREALLMANCSEEVCDKKADCIIESLVLICSYIFMHEKQLIDEKTIETIVNIFLDLFDKINHI